MATVPFSQAEKVVPEGKELVSFEEAMPPRGVLPATVYAMNTLLVQKGIYSPEEFEFQFHQFAQKNLK